MTGPDAVLAEFRVLLDYYLAVMNSDAIAARGTFCHVVLPIASVDLVCALIRYATDIFRSEPNVVTVPYPVNVIGDLHGNLFDLLRYLNDLGPPPAASYLFLGDIIDRGAFSTETLLLILLLKVLYPTHVWVIRGNHEFDEPCIGHSEFYEELSTLYDCDVIRIRLLRLFSFLPVAATIGGYAFAAHAGVSHDLQSLAQLGELRRPISTFDDRLLNDLLWSDPDDEITGVRPSPRGFGHLYGPDVTAAFLERTGLNLVVRGHRWIRSGIDYSHHKKVVTVFSASSAVSETSGGVLVLRKGQPPEELTFMPMRVISRTEVGFVHLDTSKQGASALPKISPAVSIGASMVKTWESFANLRVKPVEAAHMVPFAEKMQRNVSVRAPLRKWSVPRVLPWMRATGAVAGTPVPSRPQL
jgi:protein phosphatase